MPHQQRPRGLVTLFNGATGEGRLASEVVLGGSWLGVAHYNFKAAAAGSFAVGDEVSFWPGICLARSGEALDVLPCKAAQALANGRAGGGIVDYCERLASSREQQEALAHGAVQLCRAAGAASAHEVSAAAVPARPREERRPPAAAVATSAARQVGGPGADCSQEVAPSRSSSTQLERRAPATEPFRRLKKVAFSEAAAAELLPCPPAAASSSSSSGDSGRARGGGAGTPEQGSLGSGRSGGAEAKVPDGAAAAGPSGGLEPKVAAAQADVPPQPGARRFQRLRILGTRSGQPRDLDSAAGSPEPPATHGLHAVQAVSGLLAKRRRIDGAGLAAPWPGGELPAASEPVLPVAETKPPLPENGAAKTPPTAREAEKGGVSSDQEEDEEEEEAEEAEEEEAAVREEEAEAKQCQRPLQPEELKAKQAALPLVDYRRLLSLGGQPLTLRGINIQRPWARLLLEGTKSIEARRYPLKGYLDEDLWVIETRGGSQRSRQWSGSTAEPTPSGVRVPRERSFTSRIVGVVRFGGSFRYECREQWRRDEERHRIPPGSPFDWDGPTECPKSQMHGWHVAFARPLVEPQEGPAEKGMIGCKAVTRIALWESGLSPIKS